VVDKLAVAQVFVRALRISPISITQAISILIFILILLIPEEQKSAARERSNVTIIFRVSGANEKESTSTFIYSSTEGQTGETWESSNKGDALV
jgi:hypothetical protein